MDKQGIGTIGFIGLGNIGLPAAVNLIQSGHRVVGFSLDNLDRFAAAGGMPAASAAEVAAQCDVVINCLPVAAALEAAVYGPNGILQTLRPGTVVIELSSYALKDKERLRDAIAAKGGKLLDCELTARAAGKTVAERESVIFISGDEQTAKAMAPVFDGMTPHSVYLGGFGTSLRLKTVNNLLVGVHIMAAAEAISLGAKAGIDPQVLATLLPRGAGGSAALSNYGPRMASRKFAEDISGEMKIFDKYFDLVEDLAGECGAATPLLDVARTYFRRAMADGHAHHDVSSVFLAIEAERPQHAKK
jgi:3-hydroxyisobutyrate dehydrogenase-like beta-hydroxyacid dehydrogenase